MVSNENKQASKRQPLPKAMEMCDRKFCHTVRESNRSKQRFSIAKPGL
jgi:hypothetical protein